MREVTVSTVISAPREDVFDFVGDLAARPAYTDHYMEDYRLARVQPVGRRGGGALQARRCRSANEYAELTITKADRPRQIIEELRVGRRGRNRSVARVRLHARVGARHARGADHLQRAGRRSIDRMQEIGAAGWVRRQTKRSLERLRMIFEEPDRVQLTRATIAGYEPEKAARFGAHAGMDPARQSRL